MKHTVDKKFFPGWTRKAITFTIDDGNVPMDKKFIDIVKPAGIVGTFNLFSSNLGYMTPDGYREMYRDYEIGNHVKHHPSIFRDGEDFVFCDEPFSVESEEYDKLYKHPDIEGLGYFHVTKRWPNHERQGSKGWTKIAQTVDDYIRFSEESRVELEELFGKDKVRGFIWPGGIQNNSELIARLRAMGYESLRRAGSPAAGTNAFDLPADRLDWVYNANHRNITATSEMFESLSEDGELKFFAIGVHSVDYEREDKWDDLKAFAEKFGNRKSEYFYATVGEIFDYEDAINALVVTDDEIVNNSSLDMYIKLDGENIIVKANSTYTF